MSHGRIERAKAMWSKYFELDDNKTRKASFYNRKANKIGSYLLSQDFYILRRELSFGMAFKEWFKRKFILSARYINRCLKSEYDEFHNFVSLTITGLSLEDIKKNNEMQNYTRKIYDLMAEQGVSPDQCVALLTTLLRGQATQLSI